MSRNRPKDRWNIIPHMTGLLVLLFWQPLCSCASEPPQLPLPRHAEYRIAIHCSNKVLQLWKQTELVKEYPIETGKGGTLKKRGGDHRTPIGDYFVSWMASKISDKGHRIVEARSWCRSNRFINASTGPSLEKLWTDSYGGRQATVLSINYPNEKESRQGYTGDCIHIHADRRLRDGTLRKSYGCIHMFIPDAIELYQLVEVGTPVKILP